MKSPEDRRILPWLFANLQRTLEPDFTCSTLDRVRRLCFEIMGGISFCAHFWSQVAIYCFKNSV